MAQEVFCFGEEVILEADFLSHQRLKLEFIFHVRILISSKIDWLKSES